MPFALPCFLLKLFLHAVPQYALQWPGQYRRLLRRGRYPPDKISEKHDLAEDTKDKENKKEVKNKSTKDKKNQDKDKITKAKIDDIIIKRGAYDFSSGFKKNNIEEKKQENPQENNK